MDIREIKKLIDLMVKNDLRELAIGDGDSRVSLKRGPGEALPAVTLSQVQPVNLPAAPGAGQMAGAQNPPEQTETPASEKAFEQIVSPMVGTFYQATNPESEPFVQVGDVVGEDTVVCIVEAMKVMNEIKAGTAGTIEKVLISNGEAVEFGQPMFHVRPA